MNFSDLPVELLTVRMRTVDGDASFADGAMVKAFRPSVGQIGAYDLVLEHEVLVVRPIDASGASRLNALPSTWLARVLGQAPDRSFDVTFAPFCGEELELGDLDIGVDEPVLERYAKACYGKGSERKATVADFAKAMQDACQIFRSPEEAYFCLFAGPAAEGYLVKDDAEEASEDESVSALNSFCVQGNGWRFVVSRREQGGQPVFCVTRLTRAIARPDHALRLAKGRLKFSDRQATGAVCVLAKVQLDALVSSNGSYLKKWDEYGAKEGEILLARARKLKDVRFVSKRQFSSMDVDQTTRRAKVALRVCADSEAALKVLEGLKGECVQLVDERPSYLLNDEETFDQFCQAVVKADEDEETCKNWVPEELFKRKKPENKAQRQKESSYEVLDYDRQTHELTIDAEDAPSSGWIVLSLGGDIAQIKRRMYARQAVLNCRSAIPQLGVIIEEGGVPETPLRGSKVVEPLTAFVREKVFRNPPTFRQEEAISVALNTPDIALIQGPPGTGKTTVIAAIIERLNEEARGRGDRTKGSVLLTGFQHDAVENMIDRISINSLPVLKFGHRSGDEYSRSRQKLEEWCQELERRIAERHPNLTEARQTSELNDLYLQYLQGASQTLAVQLLAHIRSLGVSVVGVDLMREADALAVQFANQGAETLDEDGGRARLLRDIRSLRETQRGFSDDGARKAGDFLDQYGQDVLSEVDLRLLEKASVCDDGKSPEPELLAGLKRLKRRLLERFTTPPVFTKEKRNAQVESLARRAVERAREATQSGKSRRDMALLEFLGRMRADLRRMADAVAEYSFAFAATCQQSVNEVMQRQKGVRGIGSKFEYDYVIVDEAARVSPRDLLIPMVQGKHVILVGDHRQLPHIIDDEVVECFDSGEVKPGELDENEWLKRSMFQYLFKRARELQEHDGVQRRVTLDRQYRMHPLLGEFVSRNFYEHFDVTERFGSGLGAECFAFDLPEMDNRPLAWLSVPFAKGSHMREGTSWKREAEISAIAKRLKAWIDYAEAHPKPDGKPLSFGVISFYKAQTDAIAAKFKGWFEDTDETRRAEKEKRLRIGTVDSFQGMEFDVVFLSMVRTKTDRFKPTGDDERDARRLFGHLCLYNRLNVAMSRQKRLLVVVGDPELVQGDLAERKIHGLADFYRLCREKGVLLQ